MSPSARPSVTGALAIREEPEVYEAECEAVLEELGDYNMAVTGYRDYFPVALLLRDGAGVRHGALLGYGWGRWLHIRFLWVAEPLRHQGHGSALLVQAEALARARGCLGLFLETYSFQARPLYERHGFTVYGQIADHPPGHTYYLLQKRLA